MKIKDKIIDEILKKAENYRNTLQKNTYKSAHVTAEAEDKEIKILLECLITGKKTKECEEIIKETSMYKALEDFKG